MVDNDKYNDQDHDDNDYLMETIIILIRIIRMFNDDGDNHLMVSAASPFVNSPLL